MVSKERRKFPRVKDESLSLKLKLDDFDSITHTTNISSSGVYCKVDKELPLMSRMKLMLMIPDPARDGVLKDLEINGVVVRQHPVTVDGAVKHYDVAIFFEDLSEKDKDTIAGYIKRKGGE
ncbi:MAG: PilZ domain-containing protein [Candidatus Omnitrophota bacterium]|nr:PilZ domain-containing protein [Candidatus Omnitrophota bacterium]